jgi:leader peptidase (prepilin peptidase)/N-methyltransferase
VTTIPLLFDRPGAADEGSGRGDGRLAVVLGLLFGCGLERSAWRLLGERTPTWRSLPVAALGTAVLWSATGAAAPTLGWAVYGWALGGLAVLIAVTDIARRTIPNLALAVATVLWVPLWLLARPGPLLAGPVGALVFAGPLWLAARLRPGDMGLGDVKLAAVLGLYLGFPVSVLGLMFGVVAGGVGGLAVLLLPRGSRHATMPYGPFLAAGALAAWIWGIPLLRLYGA